MLDTKQFIRSLTTEVWAEIFQKRKQPLVNPFEMYDRAAQINVRNLSMPQQDEVVKEIFRQLVNYFTEVFFLSNRSICNVLVSGH